MSDEEELKIIAIIPARGGSKGIPKKNITPINGKPLISYTIEQCKSTNKIDRIIVSTDDKEIKDVSIGYGAEVIERPTEISGDTASSESAITHTLKILKKQGYITDIVVFLQCTSPIRRKDDISNAIKLLINKKYDSVFSATENYPFIWIKKNGEIKPLNEQYAKKRPIRQDREPEYIENGSIYVFRNKIFEKSNNRICGKIGIYPMPYEYSFEIDTDFDLWLCEQIIKRELS